MLAVLVPGDWPVKWVEEMILGCEEECERRGITFAGGDTKESSAPHLVGTAVGVYDSEAKVLPRNTATAGQSLILCGSVGGFLGAFLQLKRNPNSATSKQWKDYLAHPEARWWEADFCRRNLAVSAGVDASDGLFDSLVELTKSGIGVEIDLDEIPYHPFAIEAAAEFDIPLENFILGAGDWNILYACDERRIDSRSRSESHIVAHVGQFLDTPGIYASVKGRRYGLSGPRNEHFRTRLEDGASWVDEVVNRRWLTPLAQKHKDPEGTYGV
jgi:thiamine-monophosphate kinase